MAFTDEFPACTPHYSTKLLLLLSRGSAVLVAAVVLIVVLVERLIGFINGRSFSYSFGKMRRRRHERNETNGSHDTTERLKRKECFLRRVGDAYGYANSPGGFIDDWRSRELPQLIPPIIQKSQSAQTSDASSSDREEVYLDYAGSALPLKSQLQAVYSQHHQVLANPHSSGPAAARTQRLILQARQLVK